MGIIDQSINFNVSKDYLDDSNFGEVSIGSASSYSIKSTYLKIPSHIVFNDNGTNKKYNVVKIREYVFANCSALMGPLTIPTTVTSIGKYAFSGCTGLMGTLAFPATITSIGDYTFWNSGWQDFKFLAETPPEKMGVQIFGDGVTKTLWVPSAQAKKAYDPFAVSNFGLLNSTYIEVSIQPKQEKFPTWAIAVSTTVGGVVVIGAATGTGIAIHKKKFKLIK